MDGQPVSMAAHAQWSSSLRGGEGVLALAGGAHAAVVARIDTQRAISHTDPAYLSFNIDAAELRRLRRCAQA